MDLPAPLEEGLQLFVQRSSDQELSQPFAIAYYSFRRDLTSQENKFYNTIPTYLELEQRSPQVLVAMTPQYLMTCYWLCNHLYSATMDR